MARSSTGHGGPGGIPGVNQGPDQVLVGSPGGEEPDGYNATTDADNAAAEAARNGSAPAVVVGTDDSKGETYGGKALPGGGFNREPRANAPVAPDHLLDGTITTVDAAAFRRLNEGNNGGDGFILPTQHTAGSSTSRRILPPARFEVKNGAASGDVLTFYPRQRYAEFEGPDVPGGNMRVDLASPADTVILQEMMREGGMTTAQWEENKHMTGSPIVLHVGMRADSTLMEENDGVNRRAPRPQLIEEKPFCTQVSMALAGADLRSPALFPYLAVAFGWNYCKTTPATTYSGSVGPNGQPQTPAPRTPKP